MKLNLSFFLSRLYNFSFKKKINEFVYLFIISAIMTRIVSLINPDTYHLTVFLILISGILSLTTIRGSNNVIYSIILKYLSMNILDSSEYHSLDYYTQREKISDIFKEEFIQGLEALALMPFCGKIKMTTHKWVFDKILCDERITKLYIVEAIPYKTCKIPQEVLLLCPYKSIKQNFEKLNKSAFQNREQYKIILKRKK